jgi:hypothetical protein
VRLVRLRGGSALAAGAVPPNSPVTLVLDRLSALCGGSVWSTVYGLWACSSSTSSLWARVSVESARRSNSTGWL